MFVWRLGPASSLREALAIPTKESGTVRPSDVTGLHIEVGVAGFLQGPAEHFPLWDRDHARNQTQLSRSAFRSRDFESFKFEQPDGRPEVLLQKRIPVERLHAGPR